MALDRKQIFKDHGLGGNSSIHKQQKDLMYLSFHYSVIADIKLSKGPTPVTVLAVWIALASAQSTTDD